MDLNHYYIVMLLLKLIIAERDIRSEDFNSMFNYSLEIDELQTAYYNPKNKNDSKIYYLGAKLDPNFFLRNGGFNNVVFNDETEETQSRSGSDMFEDIVNIESNVITNKNNEFDESSKNNNSNKITTLLSNTSNEKTRIDVSITPLEDIINPSELERDYKQLKNPEIILDNITSTENTIDGRSAADEITVTNNYEYSISSELQSSDILDDFFVTLQDDRNEQNPNVKDGATTLQFVRQQTVELGLPKLTINHLPITRTFFQPSLLMNILTRNIPLHHHDIRQNYILLPNLRGSFLPNYFIHNLPRKKIIFTHL